VVLFQHQLCHLYRLQLQFLCPLQSPTQCKSLSLYQHRSATCLVADLVDAVDVMAVAGVEAMDMVVARNELI